MFEVLGATELVIGIIVAAIAAALTVKWLVSYLGRHGVAAFGWYRLVLAAVFVIMIWRGWVEISPDTASPPDQVQQAIATHIE